MKFKQIVKAIFFFADLFCFSIKLKSHSTIYYCLIRKHMIRKIIFELLKSFSYYYFFTRVQTFTFFKLNMLYFSFFMALKPGVGLGRLYHSPPLLPIFHQCLGHMGQAIFAHDPTIAACIWIFV